MYSYKLSDILMLSTTQNIKNIEKKLESVFETGYQSYVKELDPVLLSKRGLEPIKHILSWSVHRLDWSGPSPLLAWAWRFCSRRWVRLAFYLAHLIDEPGLDLVIESQKPNSARIYCKREIKHMTSCTR